MSETFQETEIGPIPQNWRLVTGEAITSLITKGASPRWQGFSYGDSGMLFVTSENVRDGFLDISKPKFLPLEFHEKIARSAIRKGDMLVNLVGASIGRSCLIRRELGVANINQAVAVFRPNTLVDPDFVSFAFQHPETIQRILGMQVEAARPNISLGDLRAFKLALPSLPEQQAIAAALSDADGVVAGLERVIAKKRLIKQGARQDLLTARRRLPGFSGEWKAATLSELADIRSGGTPSTSDATLWDGDIAWVTPTDITALDGRKFLSGTTRTISRAGLRQSSAELLPEGTIVMTSRATIGECAISAIPLTTNQGFKNFIPKDRADRDFLYYLLMSQKKGFIELCSGSTFLEIGKTQLTGYTVRVPETKKEQEAIAAVLSNMDAEIQTLESRLAKARSVKEGMMQNLLTGRVRLV